MSQAPTTASPSLDDYGYDTTQMNPTIREFVRETIRRAEEIANGTDWSTHDVLRQATFLMGPVLKNAPTKRRKTGWNLSQNPDYELPESAEGIPALDREAIKPEPGKGFQGRPGFTGKAAKLSRDRYWSNPDFWKAEAQKLNDMEDSKAQFKNDKTMQKKLRKELEEKADEAIACGAEVLLIAMWPRMDIKHIFCASNPAGRKFFDKMDAARLGLAEFNAYAESGGMDKELERQVGNKQKTERHPRDQMKAIVRMELLDQINKLLDSPISQLPRSELLNFIDKNGIEIQAPPEWGSAVDVCRKLSGYLKQDMDDVRAAFQNGSLQFRKRS